MSDMSPTQPGDRIRRTLADTADEIVVEPTDSATILTAATSRQRRRRGAIAGTSIAALAAVGGIVVATRDSGGDSIQSAEPVTTEVTDDAAATGGGAESDGSAGEVSNAPSAPTITTPPTLPPIGASTLAEPAADIAAGSSVFAPGYIGDSQVFAWRDGFLSIGVDYQPQPLPELPDDIVAQFPDEIVALFEESGLPPTIEEAAEVLAEAGYLDEVTELLADHPEIQDAIYAEPSTPSVTARFTTDGINWQDVAIEVPLADFGQFSVSGDRLIAWSTPYDDATGSASSLSIATSTDLSNWTLTSVELPATVPTAEYLHDNVYVNGVAVVGDRWLAIVHQEQWVDYERLIPADILTELQQGSAEYGYGYYPSPDGLVLEVCDELSCDEQRTLSWAELGLDGSPEPFDAGPNRPTLLAGTLDGNARPLPMPDGVEWGELRSIGKRFVIVGGQTPVQSFDGIDWTPLLEPDSNRWVSSVVEVDGGALLTLDGQGGLEGLLLADDGTTTEVSLPELPNRYGLWNHNGSAAWVVELHDDRFDQSPSEPVTATVGLDDGGELRITLEGESVIYEVRDANGSVIATDATDFTAITTDFLVTDDESGEAFFVVIDPDTGDEVVRVPDRDIEAAFELAYDDITPEPPAVVEEWSPDFWLIATRDGVNWLTLDLAEPDFDGDYGYYPQSAAVNGNTVLYSTATGWETAQLP